MANIVESLQHIIVCELVRCKYKNKTSELTARIANIAYKNRKFGEYALEDDIEELNIVVKKICKCWKLPGNLTFLTNRLAVSFIGIVDEILDFAKEIVEYLDKYNPNRAWFCTEQIFINQNGKVDKPKTICRILKDTEFLIEFRQGIFYHFLIRKEDLFNTAEAVLKLCRNTAKFAKIQLAIDKLKEYEDWTIIVREYFSESEESGKMTRVKMAAGALMINKNFDGILLVCQALNDENRRKFLLDHLKFMIGEYSRAINGEILKLLAENLPKQDWESAVVKNFTYFFDVIIGDWRFRTYAVDFFKNSLHLIGVKEIGHIVNFGISTVPDEEMGGYDIYSCNEITSILNNIWMITPVAIKNELLTEIIDKIKYTNINTELVKSLIEYYPFEIQCSMINTMIEANNKRFDLKSCSDLFTVLGYLNAKGNNLLIINENLKAELQRKMRDAEMTARSRGRSGRTDQWQ